MNITKEFLEKHNACSEGQDWVTENNLIGLEATELVKKLMEKEKYSWANWLIVRLLTKKQLVLYIVFAMKQWSRCFKEKYPFDKESQELIRLIRKLVENPTKKRYEALSEARASDLADLAYLADRADLIKLQIEVLNYGIKLFRK